MLSRSNVNLITVILIALSFICLGGTFYDLHNSQDINTRHPLLWPLAIGFSSAGGGLLIGMIIKTILPGEILSVMNNIKK